MNKTSKIGLLTLKASSLTTPRARSGVVAAMIAASALIAVDLPSMASPAINVSTGVNAGWDYNTTEWGANGGTGVASIVTSSDADWYGGWVANDANSSWIAANPNSTAYNNGTYSLSFNLSGYTLSSVSLSGSWAIDDRGSLYLNGNLLASLGDEAWGSLTAFSAPNSDFVAGVNTLSIVGGDTDNYLEGVRLEGDVTGSPAAAPDAASSACLLGIALAGMGAIRRFVKPGAR
ncbi:MAG: PEP-CTERM sorting domain-containing protein [Verrucomicrobiota bacterium]|jgi:hypothetical protein